MPRKSVGLTLTALLAAFVLLAAIPASAATETPVVTGTASQFGPSAADGWISWTQPSGGDFKAFVEPDAGSPTTINKTGTIGYGGGFDGSLLTYQEVPKNSDNSGVVTYDVDTQQRGTVSAANTKFWEWEPTASGEWVLVARNNSNTNADKLWHRIVLVNTVTQEKRLLAEASGRKVSLRAGQVNGDTAAWEKCTTTDCSSSFYDIPSETKTTISTSALDSSPAVAPDGTWYFIRSGIGCGQNVRIYRQEPEDLSPTLIHTLPNGTYAGDAYAAPNGSNEDLYARAACNSPKFDVYTIEGADAAVASLVSSVDPGDGSPGGGGPDPLARLRSLSPNWRNP